MSLLETLSGRQATWAFVLGCAAVTAGVLLHIPMFLMGEGLHFQLHGMPMTSDMIAGMYLIIGGSLIAAWGLLPRDVAAQRAIAAEIVIAAPEDVPLSRAHWRLMAVLVVALVIDTMKPASLGFTIDGMRNEYEVDQSIASLVPFFALIGTVVGSILWGILADIYGRKATILLSAVMFVGTSICGAMPSLEWNIGMCFMMGAAAGGMLPVTYALLAEMMPTRHRGWSLVLVGGLGAGGGYLAASAIATYVVPALSWRILWLANLPTGLLLVLLGGLIPESPKFLIARGRLLEAQAIMRTFGSIARKSGSAADEDRAPTGHRALTGAHLVGKLAALSIAALSWGVINFGLLLWLPVHLRDEGFPVAVANGLLAKSALIAIPLSLAGALLYSLWSTKWTLILVIAVTMSGLVGIDWLELLGGIDPIFPFALLIIGINGIIAILLPYTAESFPLRVRGRAVGWVAACTKGGGVLAQAIAIAKLVPPIGTVAAIMLAPVGIGLILSVIYGRETRGLDLRSLDEDC